MEDRIIKNLLNSQSNLMEPARDNFLYSLKMVKHTGLLTVRLYLFGGQTHDTAPVWRPETDLWGRVFSFYRVPSC